MALKILLADDSMTAQNMGKKILVEGGYDVVTVSNGAAAVKKIAEQKPDISILDVYMPGYTGLEVCERVRNALETAKMPVLLTVGKMEPFRAEEGNRVKADGLLIKPFEATDLLAAIKKLAEKLQAAPPEREKTVKAEPPAAPAEARYEEWKENEPPRDEERNEKIHVPQEMAVAPAFGDALEAPAPPSELHKAAEDETAISTAAAVTPAFRVEPALPDFTTEPAFPDMSMPAFGIEGVHFTETEAPTDLSVPFSEPDPVETPTSAEPGPETAPPAQMNDQAIARSPAVAEAGAGQDTVPDISLVPHANEPERPSVATSEVADLEFTSAPQSANVTAETLPELEPTILQESIPVEVVPDAALVTSPEGLAEFTTKFGVENPEDVAVGIATELPEAAVAEDTEPATEGPAETGEQAAAADEMTASPDEGLSLEEQLQRAFADVPAARPEPELVEQQPEAVLVVAAEETPEPPQPEAEAAPETEPEPALEDMGFEEPTVVVETPESAAEQAPVLEEEPAVFGSVELPEVEETIGSLEEPISAPAEEPQLVEEPVALAAEPELEPMHDFLPAAAAAPAPIVAELAQAHHVDETVVADIVNRAIERLKPDLIAAIASELKKNL